jgi:hypothetical protein
MAQLVGLMLVPVVLNHMGIFPESATTVLAEALALPRLAEGGEQDGKAGEAGIEIPQRRLGLGHLMRLRPERPPGPGVAAG